MERNTCEEFHGDIPGEFVSKLNEFEDRFVEFVRALFVRSFVIGDLLVKLKEFLRKWIEERERENERMTYLSFAF